MKKSAYLKPVDIHGVASCIGAQNVHCYGAPLIMQRLDLEAVLSSHGLAVNWIKIILVEENVESNSDKVAIIAEICRQLAENVAETLADNRMFLTIGGDHSCAMGTWSGAANAIKMEGDVGLIWMDAHMDAHTPETSHSGAIHGMPVASILGHGIPEFVNLAYSGAKIKPENICLIGIRSFEREEYELLKQLGVKIYFNKDVQKLGLQRIFDQALSQVTKNTKKFGISLDMDVIDPIDAPGVGSPEHNGIEAKELKKVFSQFKVSDKFLGFELVELNTFEDENEKTAKLAIEIIEALLT